VTGRGGAPYPRLVADIGGSGCRVGWIGAAGAPLEDVVAEARAPDPEATIDRYLGRRAARP
jgi:hypothetical protein